MLTELSKYLIGIAVALFFSQHSFAETLPVEYFASLPEVQSAQLSPDGTKLAGIVTVQGHPTVVTKEIATDKTFALIRTDNEKAKINWIRWGNSERLLISYRAPSSRYLVKTTETRLMSMRYDGSDKENMFRSRSRDNWVPQFQDNIVDILPEDEEHFLLALDAETLGSRGVYKININSGGRKLVQRGIADARSWTTDQQRRPRIAATFEGTTHKIIALDARGKNRRTIWEFESLSDDAVWPMGFGLDPHVLYVRSYYEGRYAVFKVNLEDPELRLELVLSDPYRDVEGGLIHSPRTGEAVGVYYSGGEGLYHFWDEGYSNFASSIDASLPDTSNRILGFSQNERRYLIYSSNDVSPGVYYFGDRDAKILSVIGESYPFLAAENLQPKNKIGISARDGLELEAYLTLPENAEEALPTVILPHGGPISRDDGDFDYWTQFFVNRGYAVLQVNFRGSSGYGFDFMQAGLQNYGLTMQDDLEDSTRWLIEQGITDSERVCIVGGSYGGYAALMGVAKTPDLYACAVSFAGLSDLNKVLSNARNYLNRDVVREQFGADAAQLRETSPRRLAELITAPVLLVHGDKDRVVPVDHSRLMRNALKKEDKQFEYIEFDEGDHYLSKAEHRLEFFQAMDSFLAKHLQSEAKVAAD